MQEQSDTLNYIDIDQTYEFFQPIHRFIFHYQSTEYLVRHLYYQLNWIKIWEMFVDKKINFRIDFFPNE